MKITCVNCRAELNQHIPTGEVDDGGDMDDDIKYFIFCAHCEHITVLKKDNTTRRATAAEISEVMPVVSKVDFQKNN